MKAHDRAKLQAAEALKAQIVGMGASRRSALRATAIVHLAILAWFVILTAITLEVRREVAAIRAETSPVVSR